MRTKHTCALIAAALAAGLPTAARAAVVVDFDNSAGLEKFNVTGAFTYQTTGNIIGTSAIKPNTDGRATYNLATFALGVNESITTSIKFTKTAPTGASVPIVQLGFGDVAADTFNNSTTGFNTIYARALSVDQAAGTYKLVSDNKLTTNTVASETSPNGAGTFLIANPGGNPFYQFVVTLTRTGQSTFKQNAALSLLAADNTTVATPISAFGDQTITNAGLGTAADNGVLYAGFRSTSTAGALRVDDYRIGDVVAVPEPAALGVAGLAVAGLLRRSRNA